MRDRKAHQAEKDLADSYDLQNNDEYSGSKSDSDDESAIAKMSEAERAQHKRTKKLAKSLHASYEQAKLIEEMTASKGIQSKTVDAESEDEALSMTPAMAAAAASAAAKAE